MVKKISILLVFIATLVATFVFYKKNNNYSYYTVEKKQVVRSVYASGYIDTYDAVIVKSEVSGYIEKIFVKEGDFIKKGQIIGKIGATGYGCNYWRIGKDGCNENSPLDTHLHLEIKTGPLLESPVPAECFVNGAKRNCYGYTPDNPEKYGYLNPITFLFEEAK